MHGNLFGVNAFIVLFISCTACDIEVTVESNTDNVFYAQLIASNDTSTRLFKMQSKDESVPFHLQHDSCFLKPTELRVWKKRPEDKTTPPTSDLKMILDGTGQIRFSIGDDLQPMTTGRVGVLCSFGACGRG